MQIKMFFATLIVGAQVVGATASMAGQALATPGTGEQSMTQTRGRNSSHRKSRVNRVARSTEKGTKHTARKVGKGGERAGAAVADGSENVASATVVGLKDTGRATAKGAEKTEKATVSGVRKVGRFFKKSGSK